MPKHNDLRVGNSYMFGVTINHLKLALLTSKFRIIRLSIIQKGALCTNQRITQALIKC